MGPEIIVNIISSIILTAIAYLIYPLFLIVRKEELSEKRITKRAIWNSVIVHILFIFFHLLLDGEDANATAAVTWFFIVRWLLKKYCLARSEEARLRSSYGRWYNELLTDSIGFYLIKKGLVAGEIDNAMAQQIKQGLLQKIKYEKGKKYTKRLEKFIEEANWKVLVQEVDLDTRIENGEFNTNKEQPQTINAEPECGRPIETCNPAMNHNDTIVEKGFDDIATSEASTMAGEKSVSNATHKNKTRFCSKCGSAVDMTTSVCSGCGKKYLNGKKTLKIGINIAVIIIALGFCVYWAVAYYNLSEEYDTYYVNTQWKLEEYDDYRLETQWKLNFYDENIVFVIDGYGDYYYTYDQMQTVTQGIGGYSYWAYNKEQAIARGYKAWQ